MRTGHTERAEEAYVKYRNVQARISAFEAGVSERYPTNDRLAAAYLKDSDDPEAWVYRVLCKQRANFEQIIATETAMASLYNG